MISSATLQSHFAQLAQLPANDPTLRKKVEEVVARDLASNLDGVVIGWRSAHVEKAAFPFQVEKQGRIYAGLAAEQLASNKARAAGILANPDISKMILSDVEQAIAPKATLIQHSVTDTVFREFFDAMKQAGGRTGNYTCRATLVNVGWGSGDHENVNSDRCPAGPKTTSAALARDIAGFIFAGATAAPPPPPPAAAVTAGLSVEELQALKAQIDEQLARAQQPAPTIQVSQDTVRIGGVAIPRQGGHA